MAFNLSIKDLKSHYNSLFEEFQASSSDDNFKVFLQAVVKELDADLSLDLDSLLKDYDEQVCKTRKFGALESLKRVLLHISEAANYKATEHPNWSLLAGRLEVQRIKLIVPETFREMIELEPDLWRRSEYDYLSFCRENAEELEKMIVNERDYTFYFFGIRTLEKSYLVNLTNRGINFIETPQRMYMRVATFLMMPDLNAIKEYYDALSLGYFTHASPTLFNSGLKHGNLASCFLLSMQDDFDKIFETIKQCALISKATGGIGLEISNIRHSAIGYRGQSAGIVPMLKVANDTMVYANQEGHRKGSATVFLQPWHLDTLDFISLKRQQGKEERRARDLFYAIWNCDIFMERVKNNEIWSLFCPHKVPKLTETFGEEFDEIYKEAEKNKLYESQLPARELWNELLKTQIETGMPFMCNKDSANYTSNQQNLGIIRSSNLCVAGSTKILTDTGYHKIRDLENKIVNVWNGEEFSETTVRKTGTDQELMEITFSNGSSLKCTPYHKFYLKKEYKGKVSMKRANELQINDPIIKTEYPIIKNGSSDFKYPYTHGLFTADGTYQNPKGKNMKQCPYNRLDGMKYCGIHINKPNIDVIDIIEDIDENKCLALCNCPRPTIKLYGIKKNLLKYIDYISAGKVVEETDSINVVLPRDIPKKFDVPLNCDLNTKLRWLEGLFDGDGTFSSKSLQLCSINKKFLNTVKYLFQTIGCDPKVKLSVDKPFGLLPDRKGGLIIRNTKPLYKLFLNCRDTYNLIQLGYSPKRLNLSSITYYPMSSKQFIKVTGLSLLDIKEDTFCFTEPKRNMGIFNGIIAGNCVEILEVTGDNKIASCNLASLSLDEYVNDGKYDFKALGEKTRMVVRGLNKVIDRTSYPLVKYDSNGKLLDEGPIKPYNLKYRPLGLGVNGLADTLFKLNLAWTDKEARDLNKDIFATIYYYATLESIEEAKKYGTYNGFYGSPASKGLIKPDLVARNRARLQVKKDPNLDLENLIGKYLSELSPLYDWDHLRKEIKKGLRNSLLVALMPTASSAQIRYKTESFEPMTCNLYVRSVLSGNHLIVNRYMVKDLQDLGLWNKSIINFIMKNEGSIQTIPKELLSIEKQPILERIKQKYLTAFELKQRLLMDFSIDRSSCVCQSQSFNVFIKDPSFAQLTTLHFHGQENGLPTGMYYLRTSPAVEAVKFTLEDEKMSVPLQEKKFTLEGEVDIKKSVICTDEICLSCTS